MLVIGIRLPDHPRVSGEHDSNARYTTYQNGSSPRERGALERSVCRSWCWRIIPA